jgi:uncharacterized membrane protein
MRDVRGFGENMRNNAESHARSILKAITWRTAGSLTTGLIAYAFTRKLEISAMIGLSDMVLKVGAYYLHERAWLRIKFGRSD